MASLEELGGWPGVLGPLTQRVDLTADQAHAAMDEILAGNAVPSQIAGFIVGLRVKKETIGEIAAAAQVMRELATPVEVADDKHLVDTCGTGGDAAHTFNISTCAAFVAAAAGARVAKHRGRSVSSASGSVGPFAPSRMTFARTSPAFSFVITPSSAHGASTSQSSVSRSSFEIRSAPGNPSTKRVSLRCFSSAGMSRPALFRIPHFTSETAMTLAPAACSRRAAFGRESVGHHGSARHHVSRGWKRVGRPVVRPVQRGEACSVETSGGRTDRVPRRS